MFGVESLLNSSASHRKLIEWSPLDSSHFLVASSDLRLYQTPEHSFGSKAVLDPQPSNGDAIRVVSVNSELQNVKCLCWAPYRGKKDLECFGELAAGLGNGKVVLTTLADGVPRLLKEFVPQHARACNAMSWNTYNKSLLAVGLDKVRSDSSLLIWDVTKGGDSVQSVSNTSRRFRSSKISVKSDIKEKEVQRTSSSKFSTVPLTESLESIRKPHTELGQSEATQALSWLPSMSSCIAVGTGVKWLRIYDLRQDVTAPKSVIAHSRSVNGVSFDPFNDARLLTFSEDGIIKLWDIRKLAQPVFIVNTGSKNLLEVVWSPTRSGILSSIGKDDSYIKIWELKDSLQSTGDSSSIAYNKPMRTHHTNDNIASISWHPTNEYKMLSISNAGMVELVQLHESIPISYSVSGSLGWAYGKNMFHTNEILSREAPVKHDVSYVMKERAELGYSMDIEYNYKLAQKEVLTVPIKRLYEWMRSIESISPRFLGFVSILRNENDVGMDTVETTKHIQGQFPPVYRNDRRQLVLQICGWSINESTLEEVITRLENRGLFKRATAVAVFHFQIQRAVMCLHKGAKETGDTRYQFVAMALAGFSSDPNQATIWRNTCGTVIDQLDDPYLQSCFDFLCNTGNSFNDILYNDKLRLLDRIGFACSFLPDEELLRFMNEAMVAAVCTGNIEGIPLTGLSTDGVELFQNYIDRTADIQTAALAMSRVVPSRFLDETVTKWVQIYKQLLDSWQLWHQRALLDISMSEGVHAETKPAQVFARCNFCNNTLELGLATSKANDRSRFIRSVRSHPIEKVKISGCPSCKKPLPYCSVCMLPLHCAASKAGGALNHKSKPSRKFDEWFTWCQNCKHGGHSNHLTDWFETHTQCPVTDCPCNCSSL